MIYFFHIFFFSLSYFYFSCSFFTFFFFDNLYSSWLLAFSFRLCPYYLLFLRRRQTFSFSCHPIKLAFITIPFLINTIFPPLSCSAKIIRIIIVWIRKYFHCRLILKVLSASSFWLFIVKTFLPCKKWHFLINLRILTTT